MTDLLDELVAQPAFEGSLQPLAPPGKQRALLPPDTPPLDPAELPVVSVGKPYAERVEIPAGHRLDGVADLFLIVMVCTFRPVAPKVSVTWARYAAALLPDEAGTQPEVQSLYPKEVEKEVQVTTKLGLSPTLGFDKLEFSIGEFSRTLEYPRVEPVISSAGSLASLATWDFWAATGSRIHGDKMLCALVKAPNGLGKLTVSIAVSADLQYHGVRLPAWLGGDPRKTKIPALDITVWPR